MTVFPMVAISSPLQFKGSEIMFNSSYEEIKALLVVLKKNTMDERDYHNLILEEFPLETGRFHDCIYLEGEC